MELKNIAHVQYLLFLLSLPYLIYGKNSECTKEIKDHSYLDIAMEIINKAKETNSNCPKEKVEPLDCADVLRNRHNSSGVFRVFPKNRIMNGKPLDVYCDMETDGGGWLLIQRRGNFLRSEDYFFQDWEAYKMGFGDIKEDFWLGNDNIFSLSNQKLYSIRFDLKDVEGNKRYAVYDTFWIDDEDHKYTIHINGYRGDAGDSMITSHNNRSFTTKDRDNDRNSKGNCAEKCRGGWWYNNCYSSNLNGVYLKGKHESYAKGVIWHGWKSNESMDTVEIKIRPKDFKILSLALDATPE